ncbi:MAG: hypothetical protein H7834_14315 [Magnetococcus sp. YQC-9]
MTPLVRPIEAADCDVLAAFCADFPEERRDLLFWKQRFRFWWEENPAFSESFPRGCLMENQGEIVGIFALFPTHIILKGQKCIAANMTCWRVLPNWRPHMLRMFAKLLALAGDRLIFNTTPTPAVEQILIRFGFTHFGAEIRTESVWFTAPAGSDPLTAMKRICRIAWNWAPEWLGESGMVAVPRTLGRCFGQMLGLRQGMAGAGEIGSVETIDAAFDRLWERTKTGQTLTNDRSSASLDWYLRRNPVKRPFTLLTHRRGDRLVAWLLVERRPSRHWPDAEHWLVVDGWAEDPWRESLLPLLARALQIGRTAGIPVLRIPHYHQALAETCAGIGLSRSIPKSFNSYLRWPDGALTWDPARMRVSRNQGDYGC